MSSRADLTEPISQSRERVVELERKVESLEDDLAAVRRERDAAMEWAEFLAGELHARREAEASSTPWLSRLRRLLP